MQYGFLAAIVATIAVAAHFAFQVERAGTVSFVVTMAAPTLIFAGYGLHKAWQDGILRSWFTVRSGDFSRGFAAAGVLFGLAYAASRIIAPVGSARESWLARLYLQLGDPSMLRKSVWFVVLVIVVMSVAEEVLWRGLVTTLLEERIGTTRAWVWSAVLYAIAHVPTVWGLRDPVAGANPFLPLAALGAGLLFGGMARRFERLLPSIVAHALFDWTVLMMFRLWGPSV